MECVSDKLHRALYIFLSTCIDGKNDPPNSKSYSNISTPAQPDYDCHWCGSNILSLSVGHLGGRSRNLNFNIMLRMTFPDFTFISARNDKPISASTPW